MSRILFTLCCIGLWLGCEEPVTPNLPDFEPKLVVQSNFTNGQPIQVFVSRSEEILDGDNSFIAINNADVDIFQEDSLFVETLQYMADTTTQEYFYTSTEFIPEIAKEYTIKVTAPGLGRVTAKNYIPPPVPLIFTNIRDIILDSLPAQNIIKYTFTIDLRFIDEPNVRNYYHLNFYQLKVIAEGDMEEQEVKETRTVESATNNNFFRPYYRGGVLISDEESDGHTYDYSVTFTTSIRSTQEILGEFIVELATVSEEYYLYHSSLNNQNQTYGEPFDEPIIIFNNIESGYGIFAGFSTYADTLSID